MTDEKENTKELLANRDAAWISSIQDLIANGQLKINGLTHLNMTNVKNLDSPAENDFIELLDKTIKYTEEMIKFENFHKKSKGVHIKDGNFIVNKEQTITNNENTTKQITKEDVEKYRKSMEKYQKQVKNKDSLPPEPFKDSYTIITAKT